jgi:hypothetical protein
VHSESDLPPPGWRYENMLASRQVHLFQRVGLVDQVTDVIRACRITKFEPRDPCDECKLNRLPPAHRVTLESGACAPSSRRAFDRLLNGAYGLRARYALSAAYGQEATAQACRAIWDAVTRGQLRTECGLVLDHPDSLCKTSAKVWFDSTVDKAAVHVEHAAVTCECWADSRAMDANILRSKFEGSLDLPGIQYRLRKGCTAPIPTRLDVKGAFVCDDGTEYVAISKRTRSLQLHLLGWT